MLSSWQSARGPLMEHNNIWFEPCKCNACLQADTEAASQAETAQQQRHDELQQQLKNIVSQHAAELDRTIAKVRLTSHLLLAVGMVYCLLASQSCSPHCQLCSSVQEKQTAQELETIGAAAIQDKADLLQQISAVTQHHKTKLTKTEQSLQVCLLRSRQYWHKLMYMSVHALNRRAESFAGFFGHDFHTVAKSPPCVIITAIRHASSWIL